MELSKELFFTAFFALALSFLIAKLVSAVLASDDAGRGSETIIVMEELRMRAQGRESEKRVEILKQEVVEEVDKFVAEVPVQVPDKNSEQIFEFPEQSKVVAEVPAQVPDKNSEQIFEFPEESKFVDLSDKSSSSDCESGLVEEVKIIVTGLVAEEGFESREGGDDREPVMEEVVVAQNDEIGVVGCEKNLETEVVVVAQNDEIGVVGCEKNLESGGDEKREVGLEDGDGAEEIGVVRCEENQGSGGGAEEKEMRVEGDDDGWEGIERSELEKVFAAAARYVASGDNSENLAGLGSDVEMDLYGLHKVATEGPCRESQPMALRISARANWNSWQRLGNMNPDVAMERYIALLSDKIPGWMKDSYAGDSKLDVLQEGTTSTQDPKLSTFPQHEPNRTDERKSEMVCIVEGDHLTGTSDLPEKVKE